MELPPTDELVDYNAGVLSVLLVGVIALLTLIGRVLSRLRELVPREDFAETKSRLAKLESQINEWRAFDHVRREDYESRVKMGENNTIRITRLETQIERLIKNMNSK